MGLLIFLSCVAGLGILYLFWAYKREKAETERELQEVALLRERLGMPVRASLPKPKLTKIRDQEVKTRQISSSKAFYDEGDLDVTPVVDAVTDLAGRIVLSNLVINNDSFDCGSSNYGSSDSSCGSDTSCGGGGCGGD
jgi:hypothetical protein